MTPFGSRGQAAGRRIGVKPTNCQHALVLEGYKKNTFYDSDLGDDIFEHFDIVSPIVAHDKLLRQQFIERNLHKFYDLKECEKYIKSRSELFCLYVFLRRAAILYRDTAFKEPLQLLYSFLSNKVNFDKFKKKCLRVDQVLFSDDFWATGLHEWLTCKSTLKALKRTAGCEKDVQPCLLPVEGELVFNTQMTGYFENGKFVVNEPPSMPFVFSEFNWLDFQFLVRTGTKHIIFHDFNGHSGAVYKSFVETEPSNRRPYKGQGGKTIGEAAFHNEINNALDQSTTIEGYMKVVDEIYHRWVFNDLTETIFPIEEERLLSDGTKTNDYERLRFFKDNELRSPRESIDIWRKELVVQQELSLMKDGETNHYGV